MRIKKGDVVKVRIGGNRGKTGAVIATNPKQNSVVIEGIGMVKRHIKPSQLNPRGGTKDIHIAVPVSKVMLVVGDKGKTSRIAYKMTDNGEKIRVARAFKNKEIK